MIARPSRLVPVTALLATAMLATACSSDEAPKTSTLDDVVFAAGTNDESLEAMLGAPVASTKKTRVDAPLSGASVAYPTTLGWSLGTGAASRGPIQPRRFDPLSLLEKTAHAHGTPVQGTAYFVTIKRGGAAVLRLFTRETTFAPDAKQWATFQGEATIDVLAAVFDDGRVVEGPYSGETLSFKAL